MATKQEVLRAHLKEWLATKQYSTERRALRTRLAQTIEIHLGSRGLASGTTDTRARRGIYKIMRRIFEFYCPCPLLCPLLPACTTLSEAVTADTQGAWILGSVAGSLDRPHIHLLPRILYLDFVFYKKFNPAPTNRNRVKG